MADLASQEGISSAGEDNWQQSSQVVTHAPIDAPRAFCGVPSVQLPHRGSQGGYVKGQALAGAQLPAGLHPQVTHPAASGIGATGNHNVFRASGIQGNVHSMCQTMHASGWLPRQIGSN
jgi:hypothetical protein